MVERRAWMLGIGVGALALVSAAWYRRTQAAGAGGGGAPTVEPDRPPGVPVGPFGRGATAEQVTEGIDLRGKTALVTGATAGLGLETMRVLALRGARVFGTGRTLEKARAACAGVRGDVHPLELELTDFGSIRSCANAVAAAGGPLDLLICNAGIMGLQRLEQVRGIERQFATNHLGHFLLTRMLLDQVVAAPQGRVLVLSSGMVVAAHPDGIEWDNLSGERDYNPDRMYGQSKLANALFALELSRRLRGTRATANAINPGYTDTDLFRHYRPSLTGYRGILSRGEKLTIPQGAATTCYVATAHALETTSGRFFKECNPVVPDPRASDAGAAARLWDVSESLVAAAT